MKNLDILKYNLLFAELKFLFFIIKIYNYKLLLKYNTFVKIGDNIKTLKYINNIKIIIIIKNNNNIHNI